MDILCPRRFLCPQSLGSPASFPPSTSVYMLVYIGLFSSSIYRCPYIITLRTVLLRVLEPTRRKRSCDPCELSHSLIG